MTNHTNATAPVVLVTGASSGIGLACCKKLLSSGRTVYGASRTEKADAGFTHVTMDVTDDASVEAAVADVLEREGRIDALIHCAGVSLSGPFEDTTVAEAEQHFATNYFGAVRLCRAVLPTMRAQRAGKLLVVGSIGGLIGLPYLSHYCAAKFALDGMIEAIRPELKPFGIEAAIIHPGDFKTEFAEKGTVSAATQPGTPHHELFEKAHAFYRKAEAEARSPDILAARIDSLVDKSGLPVRIIVGTTMESAGVVAKKLLPSKWFEAVLASSYG